MRKTEDTLVNKNFVWSEESSGKFNEKWCWKKPLEVLQNWPQDIRFRGEKYLLAKILKKIRMMKEIETLLWCIYNN